MLTQVIGVNCYEKHGKLLGPVFVHSTGSVHYLDIAKGEMFDFDTKLHTIS